VSGRSSSRRRFAGIVALGLGAAGAVGWVLQHRNVSRAEVSDEDIASEGLVLPDDVVHHLVVTDDGGEVHVIEKGVGSPLVLLHGFMLDSTIWVNQFRDLADSHRLIAVDLRGHGKSLPGTDGFGAPGSRFTGGSEGAERAEGAVAASLKALTEAVPMAEAAVGAPAVRRLAADVAAVLETLDVSQAVLVGHSMGGMVALQLAEDFPAVVEARVSGIVLTSTTAGPFVQLPGWAGVARVVAPVPARAALLVERLGGRVLPSRDLRYWASRIGFGGDAPTAQVRFVESLLMATPSRTVAGLLASLTVFDLSAGLADVEPPVLVVVGSHDHLTPPRMARRMAAALPHAQLVELARCGHMPMIERPHEYSHMLDEFSDKTERR